MTTVVVTGATGFLGRSLLERLAADRCYRMMPITRADGDADLHHALQGASVVAHLAGVTRPQRPEEFDEGNTQLTQRLAAAIRDSGATPLVLFASSIRAVEDTYYGRTKRAAELSLLELANDTGASVAIFRLGQVFGPGARPYYNSIVATLLADAARGRKTMVQSPDAPIDLVDVADVMEVLVRTISMPPVMSGFFKVQPTYSVTVGSVADIAQSFNDGTEMPADVLGAKLYRAYCAYRDVATVAMP